MNKKKRKTAVAGARDPPYISYAGGGCFAWPRQYYYHIFRIMRSRVCLLFHAIPHSLLAAETRGLAESMMHFNVLSFIVRPVLLCTLHMQDTDEKFICYSDAEYRNLSFDLALDMSAAIKILNVILIRNTLT